MNAEDLAGRARQERKRRKWTQEHVAEAAGMSLRAYQMFETRKTTATHPENLRAICAVLDLDPDGEDVATATRAGWPLDVQVFLDVMGAYLVTLDDGPRLEAIHDLTRQIFEARRSD